MNNVVYLGDWLRQRHFPNLPPQEKPMDKLMIEINRLNRVQEQHGFTTVWSLLYDHTQFDAPHPFVGVTELGYEAHWGPDTVVVPIEGPAWIDLWRAADKAIAASGDGHHIYIEAFTRTVSGILELHTGS